MRRLALFAAPALLVPLLAGRAGELPRSEPGMVGLAAERLAGLKPALQARVDAGKSPGGVVLVMRRGKVAYLEPFGFRDLAAKAPMAEDTIFAIASMTKPITCAAAMTLLERGQLGLDDPVAKYLPELAGLRVLGDAKDDTEAALATVPAKRPITVRDLMSHTSGFAYGGPLAADARLGRAYDQAGVMGPGVTTLAEQVARLATLPLAHQPGERWTYGHSHDVLGRVIEVASGKRFDEYLRERIFDPLDLRDTSFLVPEAKRDRVATVYIKGLAGGLSPMPRSYGSATLFAGGHGLFSTARDYARFAQMLLNGGELDGVRVLQPGTVAAMTTNQIGANRALVLFKYGLGFGLELRAAPGGGRVVDRYFWGGILSTTFWVDPRHEVVAVLMTQVLPTYSSGAEATFRRAVDAAIED